MAEARRMDCAANAAAIKEDVARAVKALAGPGIKPGLAAVLLGHVPASEIYVRTLRRAGAVQRPNHAARNGDDGRDAGPRCRVEWTRRRGRNPDSASAAAAGACEAA